MESRGGEGAPSSPLGAVIDKRPAPEASCPPAAQAKKASDLQDPSPASVSAQTGCAIQSKIKGYGLPAHLTHHVQLTARSCICNAREHRVICAFGAVRRGGQWKRPPQRVDGPFFVFISSPSSPRPWRPSASRPWRQVGRGVRRRRRNPSPSSRPHARGSALRPPRSPRDPHPRSGT